MLPKRFMNNGKASLRLNKLQHITRQQIEEKIVEGIYSFEEVPCCICQGTNFEVLSEKDRYGLYLPVAICQNCGLIQVSPRMTQESYDQFYQLEYRKLYVGNDIPTREFFQEQYKRGKGIYNYISRNLKAEISNLFVIEIGCSTGGILQYFKEKGNDVYGFDPDSEYIEFGKTNYALNIEAGNMDNILKLDKNPDIVIFSQVLEHLSDPVSDLKKLRQRLTEKTLVYIELPGVKNLEHSYRADFLQLLQNAHVYYPAQTSLNNILMKAGYGLVCADEFIHSLYKKSQLLKKNDFHYENDYRSTIAFLRRLESTRFILTPYKIKAYLKYNFIRILRAMGLYNITRRSYYRIR